MTNIYPEVEDNEVELFTLRCRRDSLLRSPYNSISNTGCTSFLVYCFASQVLEPEWTHLPGLYHLDQEVEFFRRVRIHHDSESFVILGHTPLPAAVPDLRFNRFALLRLGEDGDLINYQLWSAPNDPHPIVLTREQLHVLVNCTL